MRCRDRPEHSPGLQSKSMHSFVEVIAALNDVKDRGIVSAYAIAGAMAVTFWAEPIATFDLDSR